MRRFFQWSAWVMLAACLGIWIAAEIGASETDGRESPEHLTKEQVMPPIFKFWKMIGGDKAEMEKFLGIVQGEHEAKVYCVGRFRMPTENRVERYGITGTFHHYNDGRWVLFGLTYNPKMSSAYSREFLDYEIAAVEEQPVVQQ